MTVMAAEAAEGAGERAAAGNAAADVSARRYARRYGNQAAYVGSNAQVTPGGRGYQPVLLAEFLAAVVIVVLVPVAAGGSPTAKSKGSMSPYDTGDLKQLVGVGAVYFVLALASSGNSGRLSAWFGGLILIAIAMGKLAHGNLAAVFNTVSGTRPEDGSGDIQLA